MLGGPCPLHLVPGKMKMIKLKIKKDTCDQYVPLKISANIDISTEIYYITWCDIISFFSSIYKNNILHKSRAITFIKDLFSNLMKQFRELHQAIIHEHLAKKIYLPLILILFTPDSQRQYMNSKQAILSKNKIYLSQIHYWQLTHWNSDFYISHITNGSFI